MRRTNKLQFFIDIDGEQTPIEFDFLAKALNRMGDTVVSIARKELKKQGKVVTGNLSKSLYYSIEGSKNSIELVFQGEVPYWDFVEQGVQGANPNKPKPKNGKSKLPYSNRAPKSPFKFGSGKKQESSGTLRGGIDRWVVQKPFGKVRDEKGRFVKRSQLVRAISGNIYNYGIAPSDYYAIALDKGWKRSKRRLRVAIGKDVSMFVQKNITGIYTIKISL
tara:strand:+ start:77 stop:736 length:660 start_codon:yes stop_codon:yes gene_type:complete